jgi:TolB-like protein/Flp pilus assembly protein TadD
MPEQPHLTGAVFLSYASQDAEGAARICEALRAAGVEVWLDKSELRGGDAWDAQIKKHIHECALFIPVISAHTNARVEGYFRREWKLATRRLLDMADDAAFLVPVVIDATREVDARVPEEFLHAQWTRLPGGEMPPEFAQRVRHLLGGDGAGAHPIRSGVIPKIEPGVAVAYARKYRTPPVRLVGLTLTALLALGAGAFWYYQGANEAPAAKPAPSTASTEVAAVPDEKSIAVLPFVDMSENRDQEYFADGLAEDVRNLLASIPSLKVIGRSSSFQFKGRNEDLRDIGRQLRAAYVLEGSVRRSGDRVRVTANLIDTRDGAHQWTQTYDRAFGDVLLLQNELAMGLARALSVNVGADTLRTHTSLASPEAYDLYLRALHASDRQDRDGFEAAATYLQQSLELDPTFAAAAAQLAFIRMVQADFGFAPVKEGYESARLTALQAIRLDPASGTPRAVLGWIQFAYDWDWAAAEAELERALALSPHDSLALKCRARLAEVRGDWAEAARMVSAALARDPLDPAAHNVLSGIYLRAGRFAESEAEIRKVLEISPTYESAPYRLGIVLLTQGNAVDALTAMQETRSERLRSRGLVNVFHALNRHSESDAALAWMTREHANDDAFGIAQAHAFRRELNEAFEWLDRAYAQKDVELYHIKGDPLLKNLENDPRYQAFLRMMKLP